MVGLSRCRSGSGSFGTYGLIPFINLVLLLVMTGPSLGRLADQSVSAEDNTNISKTGLVLRTTENPQSTSVPLYQWIGNASGGSLKDTVGSESIWGRLNLYDSTSNLYLPFGDFTYIDCDNDSATQAYRNLVGNQSAFIVIFYTSKRDYCKWEGEIPRSPYILTTLDRKGATAFQNLLRSGSPLPVSISYSRSDDATPSSRSSTSSSGDNTQNPLGPAPSTSVALIVLYSITGVITALFLLIIITGAIRAHRHPDRYGPRATARLGRPRQSRAKGLARAVLDTLPIVRFGGVKEEGVKTEAELQESGVQSSDIEEEERAIDQISESPGTPGAASISLASRSNTPAVAVADGKEAAKDGKESHTEQKVCPVCIDDFEEGQDLRVLPCGHSFHPDCIDPWLLNVAGSCPLCRIDLRPEEHRQSLEVPAAPVPDSVTPSPGSRFFRYLESARQGNTEERMTALRQFREENRTGGSRPRSQDLGLGRLKRALNKRLSSGREPSAEEDPGGSSSSAPGGSGTSSDTGDGAQRE